jgi:hypothetical protein
MLVIPAKAGIQYFAGCEISHHLIYGIDNDAFSAYYLAVVMNGIA